MHDITLVFDVGGTNLRCALYFQRTDNLYNIVQCSTPHFSQFKGKPTSSIRAALLAKMKSISKPLLKGKIPKRIAIAFPGPINADGDVLTAPTIWGRAEKQPVSISCKLKQIWPQSDILLINDVSAADYNYLNQPNEDLCVVTVSSGIGHKVFIGGKAIVGRGGHGGEIGHWQVDHSSNAPICECGHQGHLGAVASGRASQWQAHKLFKENPHSYSKSILSKKSATVDGLCNEDIVEAFHSQDDWSVQLVTRLARPLGHALAGIHLAVGTERFVLIGGFALALGEGYRQLVRESARRAAWDLGLEWDSMIELGSNVTNAGLLGAGRYACQIKKHHLRLSNNKSANFEQAMHSWR